ncbi:hypothetical protein MH1LPH_17710 [Lactiplantibacillus brownii]
MLNMARTGIRTWSNRVVNSEDKLTKLSPDLTENEIEDTFFKVLSKK